MKTHLIVLLTLATAIVKAQFVTIPDTAFVNWLNDPNNGFSQCMNGNQMDTTCPKVLQPQQLYITTSNVSDLTGIEYFKNIGGIHLSSSFLTSIPPLPVSVNTIECRNSPLSQLPILPPALQVLYVSDNNLTSLPELPNTIVTLILNNNNLLSIPEIPDTLALFSCAGNYNLKCLPKLKVIRRLYFNNTDVQCVPNMGNVTESYPALSSVPLCTTSNPDNCLTYVGINEVANFSLTIYPNPSTSQFIISTDQEVQSVSVFNTSGKLILNQDESGSSDGFSINEAGMYFVEVTTSAGKAYKRVIVQQ